MRPKPRVRCFVCRKLVTTTCPNCKCCGMCGCGCYRCRHCGNTHGHNKTCRFCDVCKSACTCVKRFPTAYKLDDSPLTYLKKVTNKLERYLGLEVELATWGKFAKAPGLLQTYQNFTYTVDHDGSVVPSGCEMVLQPLRGDAFIKAMIELSETAQLGRATVNKTCGLHVHVGTSDVDYWGLRRLLVLYEHFEAEIYRYLVAPGRATASSRHGYLFCSLLDERFHAAIAGMLSAKTTSALKSKFQELVYGFKVKPNDHDSQYTYDRLRRAKYGGDRGAPGFTARYTGLNLHSWFHRGTVEWRMKEGTLDLRELVCWPLFCGWFVHTAVETCDSYVIPQYTGMRPYFLQMNLLEFIQTTMPGYVHEWAQDRLAKHKESV